MKKTIKVEADTLAQARDKFEIELAKGAFILKKNEYDAFDTQTEYHTGQSGEDAVEKAKKELAPFSIKGDLIPELEKGTNIYIPVNVQADSEWSAKIQVKSYIEDEYFRYKNFGYGVAEYYYSIESIVLIKKGFNGVFGVGKTENTYQVNVYIKANVRILYKTWAVIEAEITDDINIANKRFLKCAKDGITSEVENLLSQGIDINYCDKNGRNALFNACHDYNISNFLIEKNIDFRKIDNLGNNILTYCLRNNKHAHYQIKEFLEENGVIGVYKDGTLAETVRQAERQAEEDRKEWCSKCNKKVYTIDDGYCYDDGWMEDVDIKCEICGTILRHYRGQTR